MQIGSSKRLFPLVVVSLEVGLMLSGCATIQGYPKDPENIKLAMGAIKNGFDGTDELAYYGTTAGDPKRTSIRDSIIAKRLRGYDIEFSSFERNLLGGSNSISVGADLVGLALGGLTATVGGVGTKAALGAASTGVLGTNTAISKDLFYQKTIPALISQMEANRAKALLAIVQGMNLPDSKYPLSVALSDLNIYRDAGSIPSAISTITQVATDDKQAAQKTITFVRTAGSQAQIPVIEAIADKVKALTDIQILAVMKTMDAYLPDRPSGLRQLVQQLDDRNTREQSTAKARQVINAWVAEEDMKSDQAKQWNDAISSAIN